MGNEKTIRFGVDANSARTEMSRVRQDSRDMAQGIVEDALKMGGSYKEITKSIQEMISAMERANSIEFAERRMAARERVAEGEIGRDDYGEVLKSISEQRDLAKLQVELTKDVIDAILGTSQKEVEENRRAVLENLAATPFDERTPEQQLQDKMLGASREELEAGRVDGRRTGISSFVGIGASMIGSKDFVSGGLGAASQMGGLMMGLGGNAALAGAVVMLGSMLGKKLWDVSREYYFETGRAEAITGQSVNLEYDKGFTKYGISALDMAKRRPTLARARRSASGLEESILNQILLEKGAGIEQGQYNEMERLSLLGGGTAMRSTQSGVAMLRNAGVVKGNDLSAIPDYLQLMVQLGQEQVSQLGKIDMGINMKVISALSGIDDMTRLSAETVSTLIQGVRTGLTGNAAPQVEALQYAVLSKIKPGASMFELMEMRENPFSKENIRYLPEYLGQLNSISGGKPEMFYATIKQLFGLSNANARRLGSAYLKGKLSDFSFKEEEGIPDLAGRAEKFTPKPLEAAAVSENAMIKLVDKAREIANTMGEIDRIIKDELPKVNENLLRKHNPYLPAF